MKRCYSHNVPLRNCKTPIVCLYRRALSELAWTIIRHISTSAIKAVR